MCHFCGRCQQRVQADAYCGCKFLGSTLPLYDSNMGLGVDLVNYPGTGADSGDNP